MSEQTTFNFRLKAQQLKELHAIAKKRGVSLSAHLLEAGMNYVYTKKSDVYTKPVKDVYTNSEVKPNVYTNDSLAPVDVYTPKPKPKEAKPAPVKPWNGGYDKKAAAK